MVNGSRVAWNETQHCKILDGLVPDQLQLCRRNLELMHSIVHAAKETKGVCQKTFSDMRWNCSSIEYAPSFTPDLMKGKGSSAISSGISILCLPRHCSFSFSCSPFTCKIPIVVNGPYSVVRYSGVTILKSLEIYRIYTGVTEIRVWPGACRDCRMQSQS